MRVLALCFFMCGHETPRVDIVPIVLPPATATVETPHGFRAGDLVEVEWQGDWYLAVVREVMHDTYRIHYDGYGDEWDEVVGESRIRAVNSLTRP